MALLEDGPLDAWLFEWIMLPIEGLCTQSQWLLGLLVKENPIFHLRFVNRMACFFHKTGRALPWIGSQTLGTAKVVTLFLKALTIALTDDLEMAMAHVQTWINTHHNFWYVP